MAGISEAVRRMEAAGFRLEADGGKLRVAPAERLNEVQRGWLARHKPELVRHVKATAIPHIREMVGLFEAEVVTYEEHSEGELDDSTTPLCNQG